MAENLLSVRGLRTEFITRQGVVTAVRDVSFDIRPSEKVGIVGESGCGKSVTALSMLGLVEPPGRVAAGSVYLNGQDILALGERELQAIRGKKISLIFQDPMTSLDPIRTIGQQIVETIRKHQPRLKSRAARQLAVDLLRDVDVANADARFGDYPHQFSGGMRQRVMIAIALANNPRLLIADEPTTALDVTTQAQVLDILERLVNERQTAVMLITHNFGLVAQFCDNVRVMYAGRIVEQAATAEIFRHPNHPYTEALLKSVPNPRQLTTGDLPTISGAPPGLTRIPEGCSFEPRCPLGNGLEICRTTPPVPVSLGTGPTQVISECHFAQERWMKSHDSAQARES
jgi:oligopeptide/dipeptide ABC transporter ATP-binding protein